MEDLEDDEFITVIETEDSEELEFPKEDNGNVLLKTLRTQFPEAIGLKYKGPSGKWRAIREVDNELVAPKEGWGDTVYCLTFPSKKRKGSISTDEGELDTKVTKSVNVKGPVENRPASFKLLQDLPVLGLSRTTTAEQLKKHLEEKYDTKIAYCNVKPDKRHGMKGYAFVRFTEESAAEAALACKDDYLHGSKIQVCHKKTTPLAMYVSGLPYKATEEDIFSYFSKFGEVLEAHIPKKMKEGVSGGYGFFTMASTHVAQQLVGRNHVLLDKIIKVKVRDTKGSEGSDGFTNAHSAGGPLLPYPGRPGGPPMRGPPMRGSPMRGSPMRGSPMGGPRMGGPPMHGPPMLGPHSGNYYYAPHYDSR